MRERWIYKKLGDVTKITMGQSPSSDTYNDSDGLPFFQGNADFGKEHPTVRVFCNAPIRIAEPNDILISVRAPIGAINIADRKCCIGRGLAALRGNENTLNRFVYYFLFVSKEILITKGTGAIFKSIGKDAISSLCIPIPPLPEQERIVAELDLLTEIIDKQKAQLKELDNLALSIFYDMFGDPVENEKGWDVKMLGDVCNIERGGSPRPIDSYLTTEKDGLNWIKIGDAKEGEMVISSTKQKIKPEGLNKTRLVHKGDVILSNSMSFGRPYILGIDGCIHDGWLVIQNTEKVFNKIYLYHYLSSKQTYNTFRKMAVGGVVNNLNKNIVSKVLITIPNMTIQNTFASKIENIEKQKEAITRSIAEAQQLFDYTMDKYFG